MTYTQTTNLPTSMSLALHHWSASQIIISTKETLQNTIVPLKPNTPGHYENERVQSFPAAFSRKLAGAEPPFHEHVACCRS
jgi:hypothetical protein